jgi:hypothetical protein
VKPQAKAHYQTPRSLAKKRHPTKKEATPKCKGLRKKTSNKKRGNPETKELRKKISDEKREPQNARG